MSNIFAPAPPVEEKSNKQVNVRSVNIPNTVSPSELPDHILAFLIGFAAGFAVLFIFYKIIPLSIIGGAILGIVNIFVSAQSAIKKRKLI